MKSLRRRLVAGLSLSVLLIWLVGTGLSGLALRHELDEVLDDSLQEAARRLLALAVIGVDADASATPPASLVAETSRNVAVSGCDDGEGGGNGEQGDGDGDDDDCRTLLSYVVRDARERTVLALSDGTVHFADAFADGFSRSASHRFYGERTPDGRFSIQVADPLWHRRETLLEALSALAVPVPLLLLASLLLGWLVVRDALRTVRSLRSEIERRDGDHLAPMTSDGVPVELQPIVAAINRLLERLARALDAERSFTSSSAHELRTPIAGALALAQRLVSSLPDGEERARARQIAGQLGDLARLSEKLMQLARAESGFMSGPASIDGAVIVAHVIDEYRASTGSGTRVHYRETGEPRFLSRLDPDGLAILLRNLIENGLKHSPPDSPVDVVLDGASGTLRIINEGEPLSPGTLARVRARFARGATAAAGAGLGLAIVDAVLHGSGLELELRSPGKGGGGFEAILCSAPLTRMYGERHETASGRTDTGLSRERHTPRTEKCQ